MKKNKKPTPTKSGYGGSYRKVSAVGSLIADNMKVSLLTKDNWLDMLAAVGGGVFYVLFPTIIQRIGVKVNPPTAAGQEASYTVRWWDVNGWPMLALGLGGGLLVGAVMRSPGFMAGAVGTSIAHVLFTKLNGTLIKPMLGIYAARLDASSTSSMGDNSALDIRQAPRTLQPGAQLTQIGGRSVVVYPTTELPQNVRLNDNHAQSLADNHAQSLADNHAQSLAATMAPHSAAPTPPSRENHTTDNAWDADALAEFM